MTHHPDPAKPGAHSLRRVLAIDPTHRGFGFAVLEGSDKLVDWGLVHVRTEKHLGCIKRIVDLIESHQPTVIVAEDIAVKGFRRGERVARLIAGIQKLASIRGIRLRLVSRHKIRRAPSDSDETVTKHEIAVAIAEQFPELRPMLPRRRKCYMSEDERMAVFESIWMASLG